MIRSSPTVSIGYAREVQWRLIGEPLQPLYPQAGGDLTPDGCSTIAGGVAYQQLPVSALPQVDYPTIQVATFYPGREPRRHGHVRHCSARAAIRANAGLKQMTSTSSFGSSIITLQFDLALNIDIAEQEVQAAINASGTLLPSDLPNPPVYSKVNPADAPVLTLALTSDMLPLREVHSLADTRLAPKISQLPGSGWSRSAAVRNPPSACRPIQRLAAYGLGLTQLTQAVAAANVNQAKGNFDGPHLAYTIDANDQLTSAADYRSLVVAYRDGAPVRLSDVADVVDGVEDVRQAAWMNTTPAVIVNIQRQPSANTIAVVDSIKALLLSSRRRCPRRCTSRSSPIARRRSVPRLPMCSSSCL